jgi:uncharacterized protein with NRDE domain
LEHGIDPSASKRYAGFNLLYGPLGALRYHNNIDMRDEALEPGIHGLSNHLLDTPWPKVERAKERLKDLLAKPRQELVDGLFAMLADRTQAPSDQLPDTGLPLALERTASSIFIDAPGYRTRCSTVLVVDKHGRTHFEERTWPGGGTVTERFQLMGVAR